MQIEEAIVGGRGIHFEIAGVDKNPNRSVNGKGDAIHQAMGDLDGMNGEWAHAEALAAHDGMQLRLLQQTVFFQLVFDVGQGEFRAVDRDGELSKNPGEAADVVFVAVGEDDGANVIAIFQQIGDIGDDDVNAQQLGFWKHEPGVNHDDVVTPAKGHAVHAELTESAKRDDVQLACGHKFQ